MGTPPVASRGVLLDLAYFVGGLVLLVLAADRLVEAAIRVARALGVSAVLIGAVIIGFGTSIPEFLVSGFAALGGRLDLAVSNVVSSNAANVTLVLAMAALVSPLGTRRRVIQREGILMLGSVSLLAVLLVGGSLRRWEGFLLFGLLLVATAAMARWARDDPDGVLATPAEASEEETPHADAMWRRLVARELLIGVATLAGTIVGADLLLEGAVGLGESLGLSAAFLGMMTGVGTSLPELSAALAASRRRQSDLILGNVLGSNVFNSLGVAGIAGIFGPGVLVDMTPALLGLMVAAAAIAGLFATTGQRIVRWEAVLLLGVFVAYGVLAY